MMRNFTLIFFLLWSYSNICQEKDLSFSKEKESTESVHYLYTWSPPVRVSFDSVGAHWPEIAVDRQGRVWCGFYSDYGIYTSYFESDTWSTPEVVIPNNIYMVGWGGMTIDTANKVWVVASDDWKCFVAHRTDGGWSDTIVVPGLPACNFGPSCSADSSGNVWVVWSTDYTDWWGVFSCYYNGENWSDIIRVSYPVSADCWAKAMTTDRYGTAWIYWNGVGDTSVASLSYYSKGEWFHITPPESSGFFPDNIASHSDGSLWGCRISTGSQSHTDTARVYGMRYDTVGFSQPMMIQSVIDTGIGEYSARSQLTIDLQGKVWCVWNVCVEGTFSRLFYSIWDGNTWSEPQLVDSLEGLNPTITYDPYRNRIWVAWESQREGYPAVYVSYTQAVGIEENRNINSILGVLQNMPNPFWKTTQIRYQISNSTKISLRIYNISGQLVKTLINKKEAMPGQYTIVWDGKNNLKKEVKSGVYFLRFEAEGVIKTRKLLFIK